MKAVGNGSWRIACSVGHGIEDDIIWSTCPFAEYSLFYGALLQKRPVVSTSSGVHPCREAGMQRLSLYIEILIILCELIMTSS